MDSDIQDYIDAQFCSSLQCNCFSAISESCFLPRRTVWQNLTINGIYRLKERDNRHTNHAIHTSKQMYNFLCHRECLQGASYMLRCVYYDKMKEPRDRTAEKWHSEIPTCEVWWFERRCSLHKIAHFI